MTHLRYAPAAKATGVLSTAVLALMLNGCGADDKLPQLSEASAGTIKHCASIATSFTASGLVITSAAPVAAGTLTLAGSPIPSHCLISGKLGERVSATDGKTYSIKFEVRLPDSWNGRFLYQGNGGLDGAVSTAQGNFGGGPVTNALLQGFAVMSSDAGHSNAQNPYFGIDPQARLDYGYQAVAKLTPIGKGLVNAAYGRPADRSYFAGCSNGGRHAMVAAARYPDDYDGYLAGAPGFNLPKAAVANIWGAQQYAKVATSSDLSTAFTAAERTLVGNALLTQCDALDGVADGLIQDTAACQAKFSLETHVPTCSGARDGSCLTGAQKTVVSGIFSGAKTSTGTAIYASFPYDNGIRGSSFASWEFAAPLDRDSGAVAFTFGTPPLAEAGFNGSNYTLTSNVDSLYQQIFATSGIYTEASMSFMTPPNPTNLEKLKNRGAKMLVYHGVSDAIFSINDTKAWYDGLQAANSNKANEFARVFPVPGMGHCSGGPATDQFDMLTPLVNWVEKGQAPSSILATARGTGNAGGVNTELPSTWSATRTRPLCPYPQVARYKGSGDVEKAESFSCQ